MDQYPLALHGMSDFFVHYRDVATTQKLPELLVSSIIVSRYALNIFKLIHGPEVKEDLVVDFCARIKEAPTLGATCWIVF